MWHPCKRMICMTEAITNGINSTKHRLDHLPDKPRVIGIMDDLVSIQCKIILDLDMLRHQDPLQIEYVVAATLYSFAPLRGKGQAWIDSVASQRQGNGLLGTMLCLGQAIAEPYGCRDRSSLAGNMLHQDRNLPLELSHPHGARDALPLSLP